MPAESALHSLTACVIRLFSTVDGSRVTMSRAISRNASISASRSGGREGRLHSALVMIVASRDPSELQFAGEGESGSDILSGGLAVGSVLSHQSISFEKATTAVPDLPLGRRTGRPWFRSQRCAVLMPTLR